MPSVEWAAQRHPNYSAYAAPRPVNAPSVEEELGIEYYSSNDFHSRVGRCGLGTLFADTHRCMMGYIPGINHHSSSDLHSRVGRCG